jgi:hypothetical protein
MNIRIASAAAVLAATLTGAGMAAAQGLPAPEGAEVYFVGIEDGAEVTSPVTVVFGLRGMGVAPSAVQDEGTTGHHHLLLNRPPLGEGEFGAEEFALPVPNDETHLHFGGGQTETVLDLPPGEHTMQLVLGDWTHTPHDPPVTTEVITITVVE